MAEFLSHAACRNIDELKFKRYFHNQQLIGLSCNQCMSEWVLPVFLSNDNDATEEIYVYGQIYHLMKKQALEDNQFRFRRHQTKLDPRLAEKIIKMGDHICYKIYSGNIIEHVIVKAVNNDGNGNRFTLIHWKKLEGFNNYIVEEEENVNLSEEASCIIRCGYPDDYVRADSIELSIARATAWVGETSYNVFANNCEHFAIFCKIGCLQSFQQDLVIAKIKHLLQEALGLSVTVGAGLAKRVVARAAADALGDAVEYGATQGGTHLLTMSTQAIGLGVVIAINGVIFTIDVGRAYCRYKNDDLTFSEFKDKIWRKFITSLERNFFTGIIPAACAVAPDVAVSNPGTWAIIGVLLVGAIVGGALATANEGFGQTKLGCDLSYTLRPILDHCDEYVESIDELKPGDHVVISKWTLHPRCHIIIKEINEIENNMIAIRFTYEKGVVEEPLPFKKPVYKVIYGEFECFPPETVIARATRKRNQNSLKYSISSNNCNSFARWCKQGNAPAAYLLYKDTIRMKKPIDCFCIEF